MGFFGGSGGGASASNMVGATSSAAGTAGLVPAPAAGDDGRVLNGDATFQSPRYPTKANTVFANRAITLIGRENVNSSGTYQMYFGRQYMFPIYVPSQLTSWSINLGVGSPTTANATVGIYDYGTDTGLPKTRIDKSSSFSINTASGTNLFTSSFTTTLKRGIYFLAASFSTTANVQGFTGTFIHWLSYVSTASNLTSIRYTYTSYGTDDFPATINTSNLTAETENMPRMYITY